MLSRAEGTDIAWKAGKNVTVKVCLFRQPSAYVGHACPSFTRRPVFRAAVWAGLRVHGAQQPE